MSQRYFDTQGDDRIATGGLLAGNDVSRTWSHPVVAGDLCDAGARTVGRQLAAPERAPEAEEIL